MKVIKKIGAKKMLTDVNEQSKCYKVLNLLSVCFFFILAYQRSSK